MIRHLIDGMSLNSVLITTILIVLLATELGFRIGRHHGRTKKNDNEAPVSSMTGAHLGLLAFILAFTFSMAAAHFDSRKTLVLAEANAIGTAYLRTGLIVHPEGQILKGLLREYTALRATVTDTTDPTEIIRQSEILHTQMWQQIENITRSGNLTVMNSLLVQSFNDIISIHEERVSAGLRNRIPSTIWAALYSVLLLSMLGMGFYSGLKGARSVVPSTALALSFSMVMFLIADLDRPNTGLVQADQSVMEELALRLNQEQG